MGLGIAQGKDDGALDECGGSGYREKIVYIRGLCGGNGKTGDKEVNSDTKISGLGRGC